MHWRNVLRAGIGLPLLILLSCGSGKDWLCDCQGTYTVDLGIQTITRDYSCAFILENERKKTATSICTQTEEAIQSKNESFAVFTEGTTRGCDFYWRNNVTSVNIQCQLVEIK